MKKLVLFQNTKNDKKSAFQDYLAIFLHHSTENLILDLYYPNGIVFKLFSVYAFRGIFYNKLTSKEYALN